MHYFNYKRYFPDSVLVYIEEFNKQDGTVLFDFIDSNEYSLFTDILNINNDLNNPSMVFLTNYRGRTIQENTIYAIRPATIASWSAENIIVSDDFNSFLIGYRFEIRDSESPIFNESVSLDDFQDLFTLNYFMKGEGIESKIPIYRNGRVTVTIRNVGQGNWNEVSFSDQVKIVFDAGAPMNASRKDITTIIGNRNSLYSTSKPILILSHWDKDHYHSLIGMTDLQLQINFSAFICRDRVPNLTSRILFGRISRAVGAINTFTIPADPRTERGGPTILRRMAPLSNQITIYNAQYHKNRNISGLALSVKTSKRSIILSGDAHYDQISRDILPHLNYEHEHNLVVPHHGGKAGNYNYNIPNHVKVNEAIISVGTNRYGHPSETYVSKLQASGFKTRQTNRVGNDIVIAL